MVGITERPGPPGTRFSTIRVVAETGSTNADLLAEAAEGRSGGPADPGGGRVLVADHQRAGRGRQSRVWHDEPRRALLVSVLLWPRPELAPLIPLATGLAAVDAVDAMEAAVGSGRTGPPGGAERLVGLKWPNDVLAPGHGERKLAGILAEATTAGSADDRRLAVVVGMGMNLRRAAGGAADEVPADVPAEVAARAISLDELLGAPVERDAVLDHFLVGLERWLGCLERGEGLIDAYRAACLTIGRAVRFTTPGGEHRGTAVGVSESGALVLDTGAGRTVELDAGDAHHVPERSDPS